MPIQYTPVYQIPYPQTTDPIKLTPEALEGQAKRIEQVFQNASMPSANPSTAAVLGRLDSLETKTTVRRMQFKTGTTTIPANTQTNIGFMSKNTTGTNRNVGGDFATSTANGLLTLNEAGWYIFTAFAMPNGTPGNTWIAIRRNSDGEGFAQGGNNGAMWEATAHVNIPIYFNAGEVLRFVYFASAGHTLVTDVIVQKVQ